MKIRGSVLTLAAGGILVAGSGGGTVQAQDQAAAKHDGHAKASGQEMKGGSMDQKFVMEAAMGGMAEVELGRLATERAANADVKAFGQKMVDDHSKANEELKAIATQKSIMLPVELGPKHKAMKNQLSKLNGAAFDRAYVNMMVKDHVKDVSEFEKAANTAKDADIKGFASKTLPTLQEHLQMIKDLSGKVSGGKKMTKTASNPVR